MLQTQVMPLSNKNGKIQMSHPLCVSLVGYLLPINEATSDHFPMWRPKKKKKKNLPVCRARHQSGRSPARPRLCGGCCTLPPACPCRWPAGQSRPPPPADAPRRSKTVAPARDGPSPVGRSAARTPGPSPAPGWEGVTEAALQVNVRTTPASQPGVNSAAVLD